jgi:hypothetical protein
MPILASESAHDSEQVQKVRAAMKKVKKLKKNPGT